MIVSGGNSDFIGKESDMFFVDYKTNILKTN